MKNHNIALSLLSIFSKDFEIIIAEQLMEFFSLIVYDILCTYRKMYGCEHVLLKVIDLWKNALDSNNFAGIILIDLSKAFDCVLHGLLFRGAIIKRGPPRILAPFYLTYLIMTYSILLKNVILLIMLMTIHFQKFQVQ